MREKDVSEQTLGLGIDHGFGNIKTKHCILKSGVKGFEKEPEVMHRVVGYADRYYAVGGSRMEVKDDKTVDDDYYILTLAAVAEELKVRGIHRADVVIGAGLPLTRVGAEKDAFRTYLMREGRAAFFYEGEHYDIQITGVEIYPQGYAAILPWLSELPSPCLIMEWGSWTVDVIYMEERTPVLERCLSLPFGTIRCQREINKELMRNFNVQAEERNMEAVMLGQEIVLAKKYRVLMEEQIRSYLRKVINSMKENGFSLEMIPVVHLGGGASVVKRFGTYEPAMTRIIEGVDVNANAFEQLVRKKIEKGK